MVEASKFWFEKACSSAPCNVLIHPWTQKCGDATTTMLLSCIKGSYKFYAMVYLIQILMRGKKLGKKEMKEQFKLYLKSGIFGLSVGSSFVTLNCIFRKLFFSQFNYYTTVLLPCTVSGVAVYLEPPHRRVLVVNLFVNLVFEYWQRTLEMKGWFKRSVGRETLIFMFGSAVLFYLMRMERENNKRTPIFWFFTPPRVSKEVGEPVPGVEGRSTACPHRGPCMNYVFKGAAQLFGVGCLMTALRTVIPRLLTPTKALKSLKLSHLKLGLFFGGYIGIYRLVVCLLCRANGRDSALYALPAGFLAGAAFRASPSTPISLAPVTSSLQILFSWLYQKGKIPESWPLIEILYCLCQGLLFHARVMHEDVCPKYIVNLMHTVTSNKADEIQAAFIQRMLRFM
ncbi:transmembrane protein 135-like isoform X2 [Danaus plexippus]|uniref:Transmembrane protein 135 n=1 Tax=Danaus plexippus plexippus TaxID=278856 RepID=A0A212FAJ5_DANPL|nr:transmembrane protein 135-like isoform X2 [Danaus plexippus]OWR50748.1 Transmembrane protein 135 [Danaus plexippus plexippus]